MARISLESLAGAWLVASPALAVDRHVFITKAVGNGDLGSWPDAGSATGVAAGDAICQAAALRENLANAAGYKAWLSSETLDAYCHIFGLTGERATACNGFGPNAIFMGPWQRMDETPFATTLAHMLDPENEIYQPVLYDEFGDLIPEGVPGNSMNTWSGTGIDGAEGASTCANWTSSSASDSGLGGISKATGRDWTNFVNLPCDTASVHLLCMESGLGTPHVQPQAPGAIAFVTSVIGNGDLSTWADAAGGTGIEAGDEICHSRAKAGFLPKPHSFVALLSDSTTSAADRITTDGPFVRVDGFEFSPSKSAMFASTPTIETALNVTELETYYAEPLQFSYVWTGSSYDGTPSNDNCLDWKSADPSKLAPAGASSTARFTWINNGSGFCQQVRPLYCFSNVEHLHWDNFERGDLTRWSSSTNP